MPKVTVVGAGQSGLQLAIGLLDNGFDVTVVSNRTPEQIEQGRVMSSQCMFDTALQHERDLRLNSWEEQCPPVEGIAFAVPAPPDSPQAGGKAISWSAKLDRIAQAVDQRIKFPGWMAEFVKRGGDLVIHEATADDLEAYARDSDLVVVAAGKGDIARLFERDAERSPYDKPQRSLALTYLHGVEPRPEHSAVCFNLVPGLGEYFIFPALTLSGPCEIMVFEAVPDGPMDRWSQATDPEKHLDVSLSIVRDFVPWEYERCENATLTDENGVLTGRYAPTVRKPVATLPSGAKILGLADVVVLNDPITGQGSNNASKCAASYLKSIVDHGDQPYDEAFLRGTFETFWDDVQYSTIWTNALLAPPPEHVLKLLTAAGDEPRIAHRFANDFDDPRDFFNWFMDPDKADAYLAELATS
ncbi:styrene monooxygenase/indole monooxygenase family protein [Fodinicola acaciae]|uniref:styrene monooxygenase/indole monooxygenase family protein n=1 Tax=Fodinicola acaciae TaxID=2681555 RepID=UPI0013D1727E|nr:styrene monooxygenase/indole monooxygenase family protein [Fodinicola acaciae]